MTNTLTVDAADALVAISIECLNFSENIMIETAPLQKTSGRIQSGEYRESAPPSLQVRDARAIQRQRGKEPCFSTDKRYGCTESCEWRKDCAKLRAVWLR